MNWQEPTTYLTVSLDTADGDELFNISGEGLYVPIPPVGSIINLQVNASDDENEDDRQVHKDYRVLSTHLGFAQYHCDSNDRPTTMAPQTAIHLVVEEVPE